MSTETRERPLGIVELLTRIGDERIKFQNLDACTIRADWNHRTGSKITFGTQEPVGPTGTDALGLVVWLPRDEVRRILSPDDEPATLQPENDR